MLASQPRGMLRSLWRIARAALVAYLLVVLAIMIFEESLIFFPSRYPDGNWHPEFQFEDVWFAAADGTKLHGWYLPHDDARAIVLFAHGNGGNLSHRDFLLRALHDRLGVAVMIFDYRGYGRSEGTPTEAGVLQDARAARTWLAQRAGVPESELVLMGESLGDGVVVDLAADGGTRGLILESSFASLPDVAAHHYGWLPVKLLMKSRLDSASKIGRYHGPLLQFHGDADRIVPFETGQKLFNAANDPKEFVMIPRGNHNDPPTRRYYDALERFFARLSAK